MDSIVNKINRGHLISFEEAIVLSELESTLLCQWADEVRKKYMGDGFDFCAISSVKTGACSEDCKFCAQSSKSWDLTLKTQFLSTQEIIDQAAKMDDLGVRKFSLVTTGKRLSKTEVSNMGKVIEQINLTFPKMEICASFGLLSKDDFLLLKNAGLTRVHNNLETSRRFFKTICTTHSYDEKIEAIRVAKEVGLDVCSGLLIGMGENMSDRLEVAFDLRTLGVKSIPINFLNAIEGTPFQDLEKLSEEVMLKTVALFRLIHPRAYIRLAGGRALLTDGGRACFKSGANASITGDLLTTVGMGTKEDFDMVSELGYRFF